MNIVTSLINHLKKNQSSENDGAPEGLCPNCWGRTEYGGKFYEAVANNGVDINGKDPKVGWIQEYADKNLASLQLVNKNDSIVCNKCKVSYKSDS